MALNTFRRRLKLLIPAVNNDELKEMRGNLAMVATMVANASFQIGLNPPGGVVQDLEGFVGFPTPRDPNQARPGQSVFAMLDTSNYQRYLWINNLSFYTSVITCVWLVSGLPINPGFPSFLLSTLMIVCLGLLAISYSLGAFIVTPHDYHTSLYIFYVVLSFFAVMVILVLVARFLAIFIRDPDVDNHAHEN
ncbi:hypothetical protein HN51_046403 [Arachis hypogaea]|uniref:PGG domain-containing protein n=1 Tax=Arachis hypogaea TaxID=3818 RepID=A0A445ACF2_ARAHY|nr:uncharacterized protein DS421_12g356250 [Arachis hypogaea]RYR24127.1 hypothetical protein Ahy_B02g057623 [Arachis hypogaea]